LLASLTRLHASDTDLIDIKANEMLAVRNRRLQFCMKLLEYESEKKFNTGSVEFYSIGFQSGYWTGSLNPVERFCSDEGATLLHFFSFLPL
jgi:hypothetical protein